jgi:hypothetical protein
MSHVQDKSKYLTKAQKASLKRSTKRVPNETGRAHVRNSYNLNFSPDKRTPQDPSSIRTSNAQRVVVKQRREIALRNTLGVKLDETNGPMTRLCNKIDFENLIARHHDPADDYAFGSLHGRRVEQRKIIYGNKYCGSYSEGWARNWNLEEDGSCIYRRMASLPCVHPISALFFLVTVPCAASFDLCRGQ